MANDETNTGGSESPATQAGGADDRKPGQDAPAATRRRRRGTARLLVVPRLLNSTGAREGLHPQVEYSVLVVGTGDTILTYPDLAQAEAFVAGAVWTGYAERLEVA